MAQQRGRGVDERERKMVAKGEKRSGGQPRGGKRERKESTAFVKVLEEKESVQQWQ